MMAMECHYKWLFKGGKCYYCGDLADTKDHVPPVSAAYSFGADYFTEKKIPLLKVPACRSCNLLLGSLPYWTLGSRVKYLYERIQKKYHKILASEEWDDEELEELGYNLKNYIETHQNFHSWLERRLEFMEDCFYDIV